MESAQMVEKEKKACEERSSWVVGGGEVEMNVVYGRGEGNRMAKESDVFQEECCWGPVF